MKPGRGGSDDRLSQQIEIRRKQHLEVGDVARTDGLPGIAPSVQTCEPQVRLGAQTFEDASDHGSRDLSGARENAPCEVERAVKDGADDVADAIARRGGLLPLRFGLRLGGLHRRFDLRQIRLVRHGCPPEAAILAPSRPRKKTKKKGGLSSPP
jgi:hypothetical protein